jgi:hypothetical protein
MLQQLQNPSKESAELMSQLGINAYDAQGNFVGLAALAQQLKSHLGDLTQAQRDQALAQIFGTDAARAATVLYREGASGIQDWTNKVNDAGYAQKQAAALTDNLAGDLERLGGSFDTLLISIGQGLQGPLRGLTQMLGGLVDGVGGVINVFADLPGPVQLAVGALAAWAIGGGKVLGAVDGLRTKFQAFREEQELQRALFAMQQREASSTAAGYSEIGSALERTGGQIETTGYKAATARAALSGLAKAIGPELAAAAATYVLASAADSLTRMANAGDDAKSEIDDLNRSLKDMGNAERIDAATSAVSRFRNELTDTKRAADDASAAMAASAFNPLALGSATADYKDAAAAADATRTPSPSSRCSRPPPVTPRTCSQLRWACPAARFWRWPTRRASISARLRCCLRQAAAVPRRAGPGQRLDAGRLQHHVGVRRRDGRRSRPPRTTRRPPPTSSSCRWMCSPASRSA